MTFLYVPKNHYAAEAARTIMIGPCSLLVLLLFFLLLFLLRVLLLLALLAAVVMHFLEELAH